jgi:hypothetical protein
MTELLGVDETLAIKETIKQWGDFIGTPFLNRLYEEHLSRKLSWRMQTKMKMWMRMMRETTCDNGALWLSCSFKSVVLFSSARGTSTLMTRSLSRMIMPETVLAH